MNRPRKAAKRWTTGWPSQFRAATEFFNGIGRFATFATSLDIIPRMRIQRHGGEGMLKRGVDYSDRLYVEGAKITRVMAISARPCISGVPHRFGYLERLYADIKAKPGVARWTGETILAWYRTQVLPPR